MRSELNQHQVPRYWGSVRIGPKRSASVVNELLVTEPGAVATGCYIQPSNSFRF
jgi:hypothetical protein